MKSVLISIHPKWCELIASGKKTVEVRKTKPKIEVPFKCYIYATQPKSWFRFSSFGYASDESLWLSKGNIKMCDGFEFWADEDKQYCNLNGKVIGEFVCDKVDEYECEFVDDDCLETVHLIDREDCDDEDYPYRTLIWSNEGDNYNFSPDDEIIKGSRVSYKELKKYIGYGFNTFYGWHITDLKIYDKPRELSEFYVEGDCDCTNCKNCAWFDRGNGYNVEDDCNLAYKGAVQHKSFKPIKRPPQSWCYVESEE